MTVTKNDILFYSGMLCALWFSFFGMVWTYWAALIVAYPVGLVSLLLWWMIKDENRSRTKLIPIVLTIGLILSMLVLIYLLIWD